MADDYLLDDDPSQPGQVCWEQAANNPPPVDGPTITVAVWPTPTTFCAFRISKTMLSLVVPGGAIAFASRVGQEIGEDNRDRYTQEVDAHAFAEFVKFIHGEELACDHERDPTAKIWIKVHKLALLYRVTALAEISAKLYTDCMIEGYAAPVLSEIQEVYALTSEGSALRKAMVDVVYHFYCRRDFWWPGYIATVVQQHAAFARDFALREEEFRQDNAEFR